MCLDKNFAPLTWIEYLKLFLDEFEKTKMHSAASNSQNKFFWTSNDVCNRDLEDHT